MIEYVLLAEMTIITGVVIGGALTAFAILRKVKGTVEPIIGLVNMIGARKG